MTGLTLAFGLAFEDLYRRDGLVRLDGQFIDGLAEADTPLHDRLMAARAEPDKLTRKDESDLIVDLAPQLEDFIAGLFGIEEAAGELQARHDELGPLYSCKRLFVQRQATKAYPAAKAAAFDGDALRAQLATLFGEPFDELSFARHVLLWRDNEAEHGDKLDLAARYAGWAAATEPGKERHGGGILFNTPHRLDPTRLVPVETVDVDGVRMMKLRDAPYRFREGFALTDAGTDLAGALDHANYCIWCHNQGKDSCSKGMRETDGKTFKKTVFGVTLNGCPLDEKISEMNLIKARGRSIGALAAVTIDNPMCAATGHRICNDCMKACIYQKQEPVDIPQVETRTLSDVLRLPWGFEIYSLLTRWNPLDIRRPLPKPDSGYKVLVAGLGPAGFTLAHHLMNEGHAVVGIDGLKIEPLAPDLAGVAADGSRVAFRPIRHIEQLEEPLDRRVTGGFGGVAEYGITVRWNKNFLKIVRLLLERRDRFAMFGGVRFGGAVTTEGAFALGFDHIALCLGAGRPTVLALPNGLARGVRQASDFLMALQLTGAAKTDSIANLQIRLPVVVIGGGLTAVDTATEALAYYPLQVEKFLTRYETLAAELGEDAVRAAWSEEDGEIGDEFLHHARALREERSAAAAEGRSPRILELLDEWGGATIAYRRRLIDAPSYTLNHEEVTKALEEGIRFAEGLSPAAVEVDRFGHARALRLKLQDVGPDGMMHGLGEEIELPARSILVAAGTQPNTVLAREEPARYQTAGSWFQMRDTEGEPVTPERVAKPEVVHIVVAREGDGRAVSTFGDLHPSFNGNVVKAMAAAKQGFPVLGRVLAQRAPTEVSPAGLFERMNRDLRAVVHEVNRLAPTIVEVVIKAPAAAREFQPGQFYRLQNYESFARRLDGTLLAMEGLAMTGAWVDREQGLVSVIVLEMGGSSDLCAYLKPGEPVVLMGPTGTPTEIPSGETVLLAGGGLGNAVLFSIGQAFRERGSRTLYFAAYREMRDQFKVEQIEAASDVVVWCCDQAPGFQARRAQDRSFVGNIVQAMTAYATGELGPQQIPLREVDRVIAIGSDRMMAAVAGARHSVLKPHLDPDHTAIGSINSPMQCMMKEICAQCLQIHRDPDTGTETVVFTCSNQDQPLDRVDFACLRERLGQNAVGEKLTARWIHRATRQSPSEPPGADRPSQG